jgi:hypothetical protein
MPRHRGDFKENDQIYIEIEKKDRRKRTEEEMTEEAIRLAKYFPDNEKYSLE